jgi:hypothetical protein
VLAQRKGFSKMESYAAMGIPFFVKLGIVFFPWYLVATEYHREKKKL